MHEKCIPSIPALHFQLKPRRLRRRNAILIHSKAFLCRISPLCDAEMPEGIPLKADVEEIRESFDRIPVIHFPAGR